MGEKLLFPLLTGGTGCGPDMDEELGEEPYELADELGSCNSDLKKSSMLKSTLGSLACLVVLVLAPITWIGWPSDLGLSALKSLMLKGSFEWSRLRNPLDLLRKFWENQSEKNLLKKCNWFINLRSYLIEGFISIQIRQIKVVVRLRRRRVYVWRRYRARQRRAKFVQFAFHCLYTIAKVAISLQTK